MIKNTKGISTIICLEPKMQKKFLVSSFNFQLPAIILHLASSITIQFTQNKKISHVASKTMEPYQVYLVLTL